MDLTTEIPHSHWVSLFSRRQVLMFCPSWIHNHFGSCSLLLERTQRLRPGLGIRGQCAVFSGLIYTGAPCTDGSADGQKRAPGRTRGQVDHPGGVSVSWDVFADYISLLTVIVPLLKPCSRPICRVRDPGEKWIGEHVAALLFGVQAYYELVCEIQATLLVFICSWKELGDN